MSRSQLSALLAIRVDLESAATPDDCWTLIRSAAHDFGFHHIHPEIGDHEFDHRDSVEPLKSGTIRVPISGSDFVELARPFDVIGHATAIAPLLTCSAPPSPRNSTSSAPPPPSTPLTATKPNLCVLCNLRAPCVEVALRRRSGQHFAFYRFARLILGRLRINAARCPP